MAEEYRFFNHVDGDRQYNADEFAEYFRQVLTSGILNGGTNLQVYCSGADRAARIKPGKAWLEGYFYKLTDELELPLAEAHGTYDRIDRIVLRLDRQPEARHIRAFVLTGEPAMEPVPPELTREELVYEISLAQVLVVHNTSVVQPANAADERLDAGVCGLVNSLVQVDATHMTQQFEDWYDSKTAQWQQEWEDWFESIQGQSFVPASEKGAPEGVATLDPAGKVPSDQLPAMDYVPISDVGVPGGVAAQDEFESHKAETATQVHLAKNIGLEDAGNHFAATDIEGALSELFQSVSNGKGLLETAIADKEGTVSKQGDIATFVELDTGIRSIPQKPPQGEQTFLSSGTFIPPAGVEFIDVFMVGGGGGGASSNATNGGGGGGAGVVVSLAGVPVTPGSSYAVTVGGGGPGGKQSAGDSGGISSIKIGSTTFEARGGYGGGRGGHEGANITHAAGGHGGSGGGVGGTASDSSRYVGGAGGSNGSAGGYTGGAPSSLTYPVIPGQGQMSSTRKWGLADSTLYAGAGGGSGSSAMNGGAGGAGGGGNGGRGDSSTNGGNGTNGTGGGGGGTYHYTRTGGTGGTGLVVIRWGY